MKWKKVKDFEHYLISDSGILKSTDAYKTNSLGHVRFVKGRILNGCPDQDGYLKVILYHLDGK